jgi:hypothetical protein
LRPSISHNRPKIGRKDAKANRYESATQLMCCSGASNTRPSVGSASCTMVASTWPTKAPVQTRAITSHKWRGADAEAVSDMGARTSQRERRVSPSRVTAARAEVGGPALAAYQGKE